MTNNPRFWLAMLISMLVWTGLAVTIRIIINAATN